MRIVVVPFAVYDPFFLQVRAGVEAARNELEKNNVIVEWLNEEEVKVKRQIEILEKLRKQDVSGIVICPLNRYQLVDPINRCVDDGIPIATFCLDAPESRRFYHIGQDLKQSGRLAGYILGRFLCGKGNVGIITGFFNVEGHEERRKGFIEIIKKEFPNISIKWEEENHDHWEEAYKIVKTHLNSNVKINGIYITAGGPFGVAKAIEEYGEEKGISIACFDFTPETIEYVRKGVIDFAIGQNPFSQGYRSVMTIYGYVSRQNKPSREIEFVSMDIAFKENIEFISS